MLRSKYKQAKYELSKLTVFVSNVLYFHYMDQI